MMFSQTFEIRYVSPSIVRCEMGEFALEYEDEQGELLFRGFEKDEDGGGMLYVPPKDEWDTCFPHRTGQRRQILDRLLAFVRKKSFFASIEPSLLEPDF